MNVAPGATYEAVIDWGVTGLTGTLALRVIDNAGATTVARATTSIAEQPAGSGIYVRTGNVAPTTSGQYTLLWDDGSTTPGHVATEDLTVTSSAPAIPTGDTYATATELARILKIRTPTADQTTAMERVLLTATGEIDSEIDLADDADALAGWQLALVAEVCLERAAEHWQQVETPFGIIGFGDGVGTYIARDTWDRHALKLAPLKNQWGVA